MKKIPWKKALVFFLLAVLIYIFVTPMQQVIYNSIFTYVNSFDGVNHYPEWLASHMKQGDATSPSCTAVAYTYKSEHPQDKSDSYTLKDYKFINQKKRCLGLTSIGIPNASGSIVGATQQIVDLMDGHVLVSCTMTPKDNGEYTYNCIDDDHPVAFPQNRKLDGMPPPFPLSSAWLHLY